MLNKIIFKFGSAVGQAPLSVDLTPITVFVGPNNSGKSRVLVEIEQACRSSNILINGRLIIENIDFTAFTEAEIMEELVKIEQSPNVNEILNSGYIVIGKVNPQNNQAIRTHVHKSALISEAQRPNTSRGHFAQFLTLFTVRLDGTNRLNLLNEQAAGDFQHPINHLSHLFVDNVLRKKLRTTVYEAFSKYFVIDPTNSGKLRVRLSDREPTNEEEERGWGNNSIAFHKAASDIQYFSDGVKAFVGILATMLAGDPKIALIDEPEAFLHPALAAKLGKEIGDSVRVPKKRLFISTHSSSFLMGCIQSGTPLNIVRLTYANGVPTARLLQKDKILHLMRHPLLRSTNVLNGLFYEAVVVTEGDSDRAFYHEINERLLAKNDRRGISNCLFINAQNKQTVWSIVKPLRELGIPAVGIVDIDVVKEGGQVWTTVLDGTFIPQPSHASMHSLRQAVMKALEASGKDPKKYGGITLLNGQDKETGESLFSQMSGYGIFVVKNGELESWLKSLGITGYKSEWLVEIFKKMGENPEDRDYLNPSAGDVWDFIGEINHWVKDQGRRGIPTA